jgi:predicted metal-binding protein|uniref:DUF2284 domain-containing protein n=1 Tax=candidate division WOR-3 bacterium TaxID=2052148 RepID=A0A7C3YVE7_UNCW3
MPLKDYERYIKRGKALGAKDCKIIATKTIVTAEWVRLKCQFGCDEYGRRLTCPPYSPTPEFTQKMLRHYQYGILIHGDRWTKMRKIVARLEREIFLDGYYKAFGMGAGPCRLCARCSKFCRFPEEARPSMEACGIDVYATVRANQFPIEVLRSKTISGHYYGLVLIE